MPILSVDPLNPQEQTRTVSTAGELASARFKEAWESGVTSNFLTNDALDADEYGRQQSAASLARFGYLPNANAAPGERWTAEEARQQLKDAGLDAHLKIPDNGIGRRSLEILMDRKNAELRLQTIQQQAEGGFWQNTAGLGASFAGMLVDPVNIAVSFVPVVGQARYARWLAQAETLLGRTAIRGGVGALEGTVGFLPVEGYNYTTKQRLQADYDAYDSLLSLAGGAFFGGALHAGAGFLGDTAGRALGFEPEWARERAQTRAETVFTPERAAEAPEAPPSVRPSYLDAEARDRAIILDRLAQGRPLTREQATDQAILNLRTEIQAELLGNVSENIPSNVEATLSRVDLGQPVINIRDDYRIARIGDNKYSITPMSAVGEKKILGRDEARDFLTKVRSANVPDTERVLSSLEKGEIPPGYEARVTAEADRLLGSTGEAPLSASIREALANDPFSNVRPVIAKMAPETQQAALRMAMAQMAMGREIDVTPALLSDPMFSSFDVGGMIQARANPPKVHTPVAPREIFKGELIDEAREIVKNEEADLMARAKQAGQEVNTEATDELMAEARSAGKAAQAASLCLMRTGG